MAANCQRVIRLTDGLISSDVLTRDDAEVWAHLGNVLPPTAVAELTITHASDEGREAKSC